MITVMTKWYCLATLETGAKVPVEWEATWVPSEDGVPLSGTIVANERFAKMSDLWEVETLNTVVGPLDGPPPTHPLRGEAPKITLAQLPRDAWNKMVEEMEKVDRSHHLLSPVAQEVVEEVATKR